jgi:transposase
MPAAKRLGRPRATELRAVLGAVFYIARTGCQWRMLPKESPPFTAVPAYFYDWRDNGLFENINFHLLLRARETARREASPQVKPGCISSAFDDFDGPVTELGKGVKQGGADGEQVAQPG